jgi:lysophospholipase L1-like esterase
VTSFDSAAKRPGHWLALLRKRLLGPAALALVLLPSVQAQEVFPPSKAATAATAATLPAIPEKTTLLTPAHARWQASLAAFAKADQAQPPASDGVLFVGSSSIRMWPRLADDFRQLPVLINRGFGGSTLADCSALARELVIQYKPRQILVYAGDNDLAEGRSPAEVLESFASFVRSVRAELPASRIAYISIKPSPARLALLARIRETNTLIAGYAQTLADVRYIDIFSPMLNAQGLPRPELFQGDRLHLNEAGYQLWQSVIAAHLPAAPAPLPAQEMAVSGP